MIARIADSADKELYAEYSAMALYAISNGRKISKTLAEIQKTTSQPQETRSGKEVAEDVAKRMGIKINWGK